MDLKTLWLIPARSGSKSIIHKNIKPLNGTPLIAYRIKSALTIAEKTEVWISTDSHEYAEIAKAHGATVPFIRPSYLASDSSSSMDVVLHAMSHAENKGLNFDYIGLLEPTSPFVYYNDILNALQILKEHKDAKAIVAVKEARPNTFFIQEETEFLDQISERIRLNTTIGRQHFGKQITPSGGFYIAKWEEFKLEKNFYTEKTLPFFLNDISSLEIDEPIDWDWANFILEKELINIKDIYK